jgi:hypothetical protein
VKRDSTELTILQSLNLGEIRSDPWNPAPNLLHTAERGEDAILCFERLFSCDNPPLQTVANVIDYIHQVLEVTCIVPLSHYPPVAAATPPSHRQAILTNEHSGLVFSSRAQHRTSCVW